jgi:23S rRNA pseudouridine2605 synthase
MPPRHAYWTILVDNQPTAFRAHDPEELLATLNRLKEKHPSAVMKWFERGQLFESRDQAREQGLGQGERRWEGKRPSEEGDKPRGRDWRPGGEHRDPRQKYKDAKKAKWQRFKQKVRSRWEDRREAPPDPQTFSPPHGDPLRKQIDDERRSRRTPEDRSGAPSRPHGDPVHPTARRPKEHRGSKPKGPPRSDRPRHDEGAGSWQNRQGSDDAPQRTQNARPAPRAWRDDNRGRGWKPKGPPRERTEDRERSGGHGPMRDSRDRPREPRGEYRGKPGAVRTGHKPFRSKPSGPARGPKRFGDRKPWGSKPGGGKAWGSKQGGGKPFGPRGPRPGGGRRPGPPRGRKKPGGDEE